MMSRRLILCDLGWGSLQISWEKGRRRKHSVDYWLDYGFALGEVRGKRNAGRHNECHPAFLVLLLGSGVRVDEEDEVREESIFIHQLRSSTRR